MSETPNADEIFAVLESEVHAPLDTHSGYDGSCSECPWPMYQLPPRELAAELASWLYNRATRKDTL